MAKDGARGHGFHGQGRVKSARGGRRVRSATGARESSPGHDHHHDHGHQYHDQLRSEAGSPNSNWSTRSQNVSPALWSSPAERRAATSRPFSAPIAMSSTASAAALPRIAADGSATAPPWAPSPTQFGRGRGGSGKLRAKTATGLRESYRLQQDRRALSWATSGFHKAPEQPWVSGARRRQRLRHAHDPDGAWFA